jgi:hypothetical protein
MEHFEARVLYKPGKANMLAYYLSRPPESAHTDDEGEKRDKQITRPKHLNRQDL